MTEQAPPGGIAEIRTLEEFAAHLRRLVADAGASLRDLEDWGMANQKYLSKSSVHDVLKAVRPPTQEKLRYLLQACGVTNSPEVSAWIEARDRVVAALPDPRRQTRTTSELGPVPASRFFYKEDHLNQITSRIEALQDEVWLWGTTLSMHIPYLKRYLKDAVANDRRVKVLLIKPGGAAMAMSGLRAGPRGDSATEQEARFAIHRADLRRISQQNPGLEVRLIDYLAPYTLYAYDPGLANGMMELRLGSFHGRHDARPTFTLTRQKDEYWFEYFYDQFASVWKAADPDE
ncbi:hypothetical protein ACFU44_31355 [Nocardia rhizosphaerihabitans]|uniref:hypothetical protein n=1 Tax=Nocardia rhizosphaerihabitans TaxID=1691570 RepID=UPI00367139A8